MAQQVKDPEIFIAEAQVVAVMWVQSLAWEIPYAMGMDKKKIKKKNPTVLGELCCTS